MLEIGERGLLGLCLPDSTRPLSLLRTQSLISRRTRDERSLFKIEAMSAGESFEVNIGGGTHPTGEEYLHIRENGGDSFLFHFLPIFSFLSLALVASYVALTPGGYWESVLPNTPMPKASMDLLHPERIEEESSWMRLGKGTAGKDSPLFFLENDMKPGMMMNLHFTKTANAAPFLPRQIAESIPFSSNKMQQILNQFSVKSNSMEADIMKTTIKGCEKPAMEGEEKYCTTSFQTQLQKYSIAGAKMVGEDAVVCHNQNYPYAVFYCHKIHATKAYIVSLVGADGTRAKAVAACHADTSEWNPKHLAFQVLKVKLGTTIPICHFLNEDDIVWVANQNLICKTYTIFHPPVLIWAPSVQFPVKKLSAVCPTSSHEYLTCLEKNCEHQGGKECGKQMHYSARCLTPMCRSWGSYGGLRRSESVGQMGIFGGDCHIIVRFHPSDPLSMNICSQGYIESLISCKEGS
ncbi:BURP domain-containing protein 5-like [Cornus florida]|uniref:BURP domain-containing protein 5-like n=1 Tax=Cornus florida TaxID=4283 RepID=UPI00289DFC48|nr:BURP domain-containing protein 5-like [Cornus florida]